MTDKETNVDRVHSIRTPIRSRYCLVFAGVVNAMMVTVALGEVPEGFTEPFRQIDIAAAEAGIIDTIQVSEGDQVRAKQIVAELKSEVLTASLNVAGKLKEARGKLNSATAELKQRTVYLAKLHKLHQHASQEELEKASLEREIAEAQLLAVREELEVRDFEYKRIEEEIERRRLRSPIDGVVIKIEKEEGEFVSSSQPTVMTVVQLDPLLAVFSVTPEISNALVSGQKVKVQIGNSKTNIDAVVHFLSPVMDAQSGTVLVKVSVPNPKGRFRSGEQCHLIVADAIPPRTRTDTPTARSASLK